MLTSVDTDPGLTPISLASQFWERFRVRRFQRAAVSSRTTIRSLRLRGPFRLWVPLWVSLDLIEFAKSPDFEGEYACLSGPEAGAIGVYKISWQNDQGTPRWEALLPVFLPEGGNGTVANPDFFGTLLANKAIAERRPCRVDIRELQAALAVLKSRADAELANQCTRLRHPNDIVLLAAADLASQE